MPVRGLLKIGDVARRAGVSVPTIKHYLREGLIAPTKKTGRTMAWYDPSVVARIRSIRELQATRFLPLDVIRETLGRDSEAQDDLAAAEAIAKVLAKRSPRSRTRAEVLAGGASAIELDWLARTGLAVPHGPDARYAGDDLALLATLGTARRAGITPEMLPFHILAEYLVAMRALVDVELRMYRAGVLTKARAADVPRLTTAATRLSERLVVLVRRKLLLPTLQKLIEEDHRDPSVDGGPTGRVRQQRKSPRRKSA